MSISNKKILVSMIAYREKYLAESVRDCYEKADNPENLIFSIVAEQAREDLHADLSFIPEDQIIYKKFDLSKYRGVLWSRAETLKVDTDYDYILYTCGHNRFISSWDTTTLKEYSKAVVGSGKSDKEAKVLITVAGPEFHALGNGDADISEKDLGNLVNYYRGILDSDFVPGYGFSTQKPMVSRDALVEEYYLQFSWVFAPKKFVIEVPLDPDVNYHAEEIYISVQAWCKGWRFYATPQIMYLHDTQKLYQDEELPRMTTHRPWSDGNKDSFWGQCDRSAVKLNKLLSGKMTQESEKYSIENILEYCKSSGLDIKWTEYNPEYLYLGIRRHTEPFRGEEPIYLGY